MARLNTELAPRFAAFLFLLGPSRQRPSHVLPTPSRGPSRPASGVVCILQGVRGAGTLPGPRPLPGRPD